MISEDDVSPAVRFNNYKVMPFKVLQTTVIVEAYLLIKKSKKLPSAVAFLANK